ncbi:PH domain-containing protein [uncultured Jatrophihabitans sp.]|uniref:PH domain-containing protein n=1 Tax=uncultured Jatrophihabitans sp. TaxID=1610747 RepID=UPI0035C95DF9
MDDDSRPAQAAFRPDPRPTAGALGGCVVAALIAALSSDAQGRLLAGIAAVVLAAYVSADVLFTPRLVVGGDGIVIRSPLVRATLGWAEIDDVRADARTRLGLRSTTLEIDAGPMLAVLSRRALNTDPHDVAEVIAAFRPR